MLVTATSSAEILSILLDEDEEDEAGIEFGAHQAIIVRDETARDRLLDEFPELALVKARVLTVVESKGLEVRAAQHIS